jgi:hypothetical protein
LIASAAIGAGSQRRYFGGAPAIVASCSKLQCVSAAVRPAASIITRPLSPAASVLKLPVSMSRSIVRMRLARAASWSASTLA